MNHRFRTFSLIVAAACSLTGSPVFAQLAAPGTDARMQRERAACDGNQQDRAACLREAGAAQQEARRDGLTDPGGSAEDRNALDRCRQQPPSAQAECEARIQGTGKTTTEGSVMGGGVIRETVTPVAPQK
ncbi:MAG: hypothetical protein ACRYGA_15875 [Janthinobacterium lividum]